MSARPEGTPALERTKRQFFGFCHAATQLALQLQQERIQVVRSNKVVRRIPTESNGTSAMDFGHMHVVLKWCVSSGFMDWNDDYYYFYYFYYFLFVCCYKTRKSLLRLPPWVPSNLKPLARGVYSLGPRSSSCGPTT